MTVSFIRSSSLTSMTVRYSTVIGRSASSVSRNLPRVSPRRDPLMATGSISNRQLSGAIEHCLPDIAVLVP